MHEERLELTYLKVQSQIKNGESWTESVDEHIQRVEKLLADD